MRNRMFLGIMAGALICAILVGAMIGVLKLNTSGDEARAQESNTWQMVEFGAWLAGETPRSFIEQLPADCDLVPDPHDEWVMFYRCPEPFEPVNRP